MLFHIDRKSNEPIYKQIIKKIRALIQKNVLIPGEKIPSVGELATLLVVNPKYVFDAYCELEKEGVLQIVNGKGYFVNTQINPVKDEKKSLEIKIQLEALIEEAYRLSLCENEFTAWVHHYYHRAMQQNHTDLKD